MGGAPSSWVGVSVLDQSPPQFSHWSAPSGDQEHRIRESVPLLSFSVLTVNVVSSRISPGLLVYLECHTQIHGCQSSVISPLQMRGAFAHASLPVQIILPSLTTVPVPKAPGGKGDLPGLYHLNHHKAHQIGRKRDWWSCISHCTRLTAGFSSLKKENRQRDPR